MDHHNVQLKGKEYDINRMNCYHNFYYDKFNLLLTRHSDNYDRSTSLQFSFNPCSCPFCNPNPAVNRIDAPVQRPHFTSVSSDTATSSSITPRVTLKPRQPAVNRIDVVGVNVHSKTTSSATHGHSFRTLVSTTLGPHISLNPRDPAVNRIDAVGVKADHKTTRTTEGTASGSISSIRPHITLNPRNPADASGHKP